MADVFEGLAKKLDQFPEGYPAAESGVELKILRRVFTPEEAAIALELTSSPETAEQIAARLGKPIEDVKALLDAMVKKGVIGGKIISEQQAYLLIPYVVGIFEMYSFVNTDEVFAKLHEEYLPTLSKTLGGHYPRLGRVLPVREHISPGTPVHLYEDIRTIIESGLVFFQTNECVCRKTRALAGHPCKIDPDHKLACLALLTEVSEEGQGGGTQFPMKLITKEEALDILDKAVEKGLIPSTYLGVQKEGAIMSVCFCCPCCCSILRGRTEHQAPYGFGRTNYVALIDQDACIQCGVCADERCAFKAIKVEGGAYTVLPDACIGCGSCTVTCPTEAITLVQRPEAEQEEVPSDTKDWRAKRAANRFKTA